MSIVDEKKQKCLNTCGKWWAVIKRETDTTREIARVNIKCNSWLCSTCAKKRSRKFANSVKEYFKDDKVFFLTLTMDRTKNLEDSFKTINANWNRLRTLISKKYGAFNYVRVLEAQPGSGYPHLHIFLNIYIGHEFYNKYVPMVGFGKIWKARSVTSVEAFYYVIKYLKKEWTNVEALEVLIENNLRRCSGSRGFVLVGGKSNNWVLVSFQNSFESSVSYVIDYVKAHMDNLYNLCGSARSPNWDSFLLEWDVETTHRLPGDVQSKIDNQIIDYQIETAFSVEPPSCVGCVPF